MDVLKIQIEELQDKNNALNLTIIKQREEIGRM